MKKNLLYSIVIVLLSLLTSGCYHCGYPTECWKGYFNESPCGTYTVSPCQKYCDACTFNDNACKVCLHCVELDGCGYGSVKMCPPHR